MDSQPQAVCGIFRGFIKSGDNLCSEVNALDAVKGPITPVQSVLLIVNSQASWLEQIGVYNNLSSRAVQTSSLNARFRHTGICPVHVPEDHIQEWPASVSWLQ